MIEFKTGNILNEPAEALVNTVNCVGIMGRGIALQFKKAYPQNFKEYAAACKKEVVKPGQMFTVEVSRLTNPRYIINFPTKRHWKGKSCLEDIDTGLLSLVSEIKRLGIKSVAIPPLGCGLGGLKWADVRQRIEASFKDLVDVNAIVFSPNGSPGAHEICQSSEVPVMTAGRAALIGLINQYLRGLMDPVITLLEIQKLMYFMQESGECLKLKYVKAFYGPYAENIKHVLNHVEGHFLSGYGDGGEEPGKEIKLIPGAIEDANEFLRDKPETMSNLQRVADLVEGFETPFGMELLATVHWVVTRESAENIDDAIARIYDWNDRKRQFTKRQIERTYEILRSKGWF